MTKKDFQLIAQTILGMPFDSVTNMSPMNMRLIVASHFADSLASTNPRFKRDLFIQASTGEVPVTARKAKEG